MEIDAQLAPGPPDRAEALGLSLYYEYSAVALIKALAG